MIRTPLRNRSAWFCARCAIRQKNTIATLNNKNKLKNSSYFKIKVCASCLSTYSLFLSAARLQTHALRAAVYLGVASQAQVFCDPLQGFCNGLLFVACSSTALTPDADTNAARAAGPWAAVCGWRGRRSESQLPAKRHARSGFSDVPSSDLAGAASRLPPTDNWSGTQLSFSLSDEVDPRNTHELCARFLCDAPAFVRVTHGTSLPRAQVYAGWVAREPCQQRARRATQSYSRPLAPRRLPV